MIEPDSRRALPYFLSASLVLPALASAQGATSPVTFVHRPIDNKRTESVAVLDMDKDGKLDIASANHWYRAGDWTPRPFRTIGGSIGPDWNGYLHSDTDIPFDVDGDGWTDLVACSWHTNRFEWWKNPGAQGGTWTMATVYQGGPHHGNGLWDIDGDGQAREFLPLTFPTYWFEVVKEGNSTRWVRHTVSAKENNMGGGVGDINGDGRPDIIKPDAWWEAPANPRTGAWIEHPLSLGSRLDAAGSQKPAFPVWRGSHACGTHEHTQRIWTHDVNRDGKRDIIAGSAHGIGLFWYEQEGAGGCGWKRHIIDTTWSQAHNIEMADLDKDGDPDLLAGKRFYAHNDALDPQSHAPLGLYWYEMRPGTADPFVKHVISYDKDIGAGFNIVAVDLDGDSDLDVVVTGKKGGPHLFENRLNPSTGSLALLTSPRGPGMSGWRLAGGGYPVWGRGTVWHDLRGRREAERRR